MFGVFFLYKLNYLVLNDSRCPNDSEKVGLWTVTNDALNELNVDHSEVWRANTYATISKRILSCEQNQKFISKQTQKLV